MERPPGLASSLGVLTGLLCLHLSQTGLPIRGHCALSSQLRWEPDALTSHRSPRSTQPGPWEGSFGEGRAHCKSPRGEKTQCSLSVNVPPVGVC